jgi:hypothetical protein
VHWLNPECWWDIIVGTKMNSVIYFEGANSEGIGASSGITFPSLCFKAWLKLVPNIMQPLRKSICLIMTL